MGRRALPLVLLAFLLLAPALLGGCRGPEEPPADAGPWMAPDLGQEGPLDQGVDGGPPAPDLGPPPPPAVAFRDVASVLGLDVPLNPSGPCPYRLNGSCEPAQFAGGAAVTDLEGDGYLDVYLTSIDGPGRLYRFSGLRYVDVTAKYGLDTVPMRTNGAAFVDIDRDGDEDLYLTTHVQADERPSPDDPSRYLLYIREGEQFVEDTLARGAQVESLEDSPSRAGVSVAVGDYDLDGWPDLHVTEWLGLDQDWPPHTRLLRNLGPTAPGHVEDVTEAANALSVDRECWIGEKNCQAVAFGSGFTDFDGDGWPDLAIVKDFGESRLLWNQGDGTFLDGTAAAGVGTDENGMGSTFGDVDNDGDMDWFVTAIGDPFMTCGDMLCNWGWSGNRLYRNDGDRTFTDITDEADVRMGGWGWGAAFIDYDNDADLDLVMTNGVEFEDTPRDDQFEDDLMRFWENDGTGHFVERSMELNLLHRGSGKGLVVFDHQADGDQDILIVVNGGPPVLYQNDGGNEAGSWLRLQLVGTASTPDSLGARAMVRIREGDRPIMRELNSATHFLGQSERVIHVGLGPGVERVAEVEVVWPSGRRLVRTDVEANRTLTWREPDE
ncbi:MAG: CRTAC1 family protein [Sandaracinaceae bacterium]